MVKTNRRQKRKGEKILDLNDVAKIIQEYLADSPLVVLESGASVPYGLPTMSGLADVLRKVPKLLRVCPGGKPFWM